MVSAVEKSIRDAGLGLNPASDGMLIRVRSPQLTTERSNELAKMAHKYAEGAKFGARRAARRHGSRDTKKSMKWARIWQDKPSEVHFSRIFSSSKKVDEALVDKEKDIRQV